MRRGEAEGEARLVAVVNRASERHWQAGAWILARRHPERWGLGHGARRASAEPLATAGDSDLDGSDPETRRALSELLRRRPADHSG